MLNDLVNFVIGMEEKNRDIIQLELGKILSNYNIVKNDEIGDMDDLKEKIDLFISSKTIEGLSSATLRNYKLDLRIFNNKVKKKTIDINTNDIRMHLSEYKHLKMSSMGRKLSVLKSFFGWLASEEIIPRDPTAKLKPPKEEKRFPKSLNVEELEMLREACQTTRQRALVEFLYATGCRLSEVQQLNIADINYNEKSCKVIGKGNKEREVYFSYKADYHLKKYLTSRNDDNPALFVSERKPHQRLSNRGIQREIAAIAKQSEVKSHISPHVMRHTFACLTLNNGAELSAVQAMLGHSDPSTTQIYAQLTDAKKKEQHKKYLIQ